MEQIPVLSCEHVSFCYPRQTVDAIHDISFAVRESEFVVLCGQSGCGKTTLLRHFKKNQIPFGSGSGHIYYRGDDLEQMDDRESAVGIGYVGQNPDTGLVTDKVWHELAFGLENLGVPGAQIRRRVAEIAQYFGMENWFHKKVSELSGGQKQIINLASVVIMQPEVLLLDEPTAQLDPIGTRRFLDTLVRLNRDMGTAVLLSEQRLEEVLPLADRVLILQDGKLVGDVLPQQCGNVLWEYEMEHGTCLPVASAMPVAVKVWQACHEDEEKESPVSIREGRGWLQKCVRKMGQKKIDQSRFSRQADIKGSYGVSDDKPHKQVDPAGTEKKAESMALSAEHLTFSYQKGRKVLDDFSLQVPKGSIFAILGGNGSGKSTALKVMMGIYKQHRGKVKADGKVRYLAQNPRSLFTELTVEEELAVMLSGNVLPGGLESIVGKPDEISGQETTESVLVEKLLSYLELAPQREQNPMDLSGGQQQRLAMGKLLMTDPDILLLDEPTKGLDGAFKEKLAVLLKDLCQKGKTIVLVSHDMAFCAEYADTCGLLFDGQMISQEKTETFFRENVFYTTPAARMAQGIFTDCFRAEDVIRALQKVRAG